MVLAATLVFASIASFQPLRVFAASGLLTVSDLYTDKARYNPGDSAVISVELKNDDVSSWSGLVYLEVYHLETLVYKDSLSTTVPSAGEATEAFKWITPKDDFTGYLIKVSAEDSFGAAGLDVSSDFTKFPRYGYVADFDENETQAQSAAKISELSRDFNINAIQFYDWMWRHEVLIKRTDGKIDPTWDDLFDRTVSWATIQNQISAAHDNNASAMAYVMSYAAREGYDQFNVQPSWGIFQDRNHLSQFNVDFNNGKYLWLFNPANTDWQNYIIDQYSDALQTGLFDGLQIDQMGQRNDIYDFWGRSVYLKDTFSDLINAAKSELDGQGINNTITFNVVDGTVNGWGLWDAALNADTDFNFSEIWWLSNNYNDLKSYIEQFRTESDGKSLVLAAYMNYRDDTGDRYEAEDGVLVGVAVSKEHPGYTGSGYVDQFDSVGDSVTMTITVTEDGLCPLVFRYGNATGGEATRNIYIDNVLDATVDFHNQSSWDTWVFDAYYTPYLTAGTHTVKVAYDSGNSGAINLDNMTLGYFDDNSVRLADATIAASGASHIELGANIYEAVMLPHEYYPSTSKAMRDSLRNAMSNHYNFITAYENLLYDTDVTYGDQGTQHIEIKGESISGSGENGKIWNIFRDKGDYDIIHLINLTGEDDTQWRNSTEQPVFKTNLQTKYYIGPDASVSGVYVASPDYDQGAATALSYTIGADTSGTYIEFTVPSLEYWDMIFIKRTVESKQVYEAEDALKNGVGVNNNHPGYSGTGFVDQFDASGKMVSFIIDVPEAGQYSLKFRYGNATGNEATRNLYVDNIYRGVVYFENLADWDTWDYGEIAVDLEAGVHNLVLLFGESNHDAINLDCLEVEPKFETTHSLYMNNWDDTVAIWQDTFLNQMTALNGSGPGLYELRHYAGGENDDYNQNLIKNYSAFFREETSGAKYTDGSKFRSSGFFSDNGVLTSDYLSYDGTVLSDEITRSYAMPPTQDFVVVKYTVKNNGSQTESYNILDMLHVNNLSPKGDVTAEYDSALNYFNIQNNEYYIAHGALQAIDGYQAADDTVTDPAQSDCSPWVTFDANGKLNNNALISAYDVSTGMTNLVTLSPGQSQTLYFYLAVADTSSDLEKIVDFITAQSADYAFDQTARIYQTWLNSGQTTNFDNKALNDAYNNILVTMKQAIVPGSYSDGSNTVYKFAAMPATTNPSAYSYKVWARDSAVSAMAMDAAGHYDEAEAYWYWLADRQIKTSQGGWRQPGTFWTCYWLWDNSPVSFVEPEYDSIGMFLIGAYRHYENLPTTAQKANFLSNIWDSYKLSADFVMTNISQGGYGAADCSIWEETVEYNAFTQALYIAGLDAAQMMAKANGLQDLAESYNGAAGTIRTAVQRDMTDGSYPGLWNNNDSYFNRSVGTDYSPNELHDSSSDVLITYGVVDAESPRAKSHIDSTLSVLGHDGYGVARYQNDGFYHRMPWDPGGNEALEDEPSWPQMAMWIGMYEIQSGYKAYKANALRRLEWYIERTAAGYMVAGEAISNVTRKPCVSTMCEPITGAAYIMTSLAYLEKFDMRILPDLFNVGANKQINVTEGTNGDWEQWSNVPYYLDKLGDAEDDGYDISRVYAANDGDNLYLRIDVSEKALPDYGESDKFVITAYAQNFDGGEGTMAQSLYGSNLSQAMDYAVSRPSDSNDFAKYTASSNAWNFSGNITSVIAPQWEPDSGRIEMVIPLSQLSASGQVSADEWSYIDVVISKNTASSWEDVDIMSIHYRVTGASEEWLKGNFD
jgi:GH15 family glucan-1,4-alpha-glucosidase